MSLPVGKLPHEALTRLLARNPPVDERVLVGPGIGEDAAVIDMGDRCLVAKTDPITFATDEIGWYAVNVNANDVACSGGVPKWFLATLLLPAGETTIADVEAIFDQMADACRALDVSLVGGHTEMTYGIDRPIVVGQMLGEVPSDQYLSTSGARSGDAIILTKGIAVEGTAIIAREKREVLEKSVPGDLIERGARMLHEPGISVVADARHALAAGGVHALHDPTEGGVATGLYEIAAAAGIGLVIEHDKLPVLEACRAFCETLGLNPLGLIASGSLLISAASDHAGPILDRLRSADVCASVIGRAVPAERGVHLRFPDGRLEPLPVFERDEIARLFD